MIIHIRNKLARLGGSQWYKDTTVRKSSAVCGGEMTDRDLGYPRKNQSVDRMAAQVTAENELCATCRQIVGSRQGTFSFASKRRRNRDR